MVDVNPKLTKSLDAITLVGGMAAKPFAEKVVSPVVGNGNITSGVLKMGIAIAAQKFIPGKIGDVATIAFGADGAEDLILGLSGMSSTPAGGSQIDF